QRASSRVGRACGTLEVGLAMALGAAVGAFAAAALALADPSASELDRPGQRAVISRRVGRGSALRGSGHAPRKPRMGRVHCEAARPGVDNPPSWPPEDTAGVRLLQSMSPEPFFC